MCPQPPLQMPHTENAQTLLRCRWPKSQDDNCSRWSVSSKTKLNSSFSMEQTIEAKWGEIRREMEQGGRWWKLKHPVKGQKLQIRLKNLQDWEQQENCLVLLPFMLCGGKPPDFAWIKRLDYDKKYLLLPSAYPITATAQETPNFSHLHNPKEVMMCVCLIPCNMS